MKYTITVTNPTDYYIVRHTFYNDRAFLDIIDLEEWKTFQVISVGSDYTQWIKNIVKKILGNTNCEVYYVIEE